MERSAAGSREGAGPDGARSGRVGHIAWSAWGEGEGTPILALHGLTDSRECWVPLVPLLAQGRTVVAVDARGHGGSGVPPEPFTVMALAQDAAAIVRTVLDRPVLAVGHSMGGLVAEELALGFPELVVGLVLEDPAWSAAKDTDAAGVPLWLRGFVTTLRGLSQEELEARSRAENPGWVEDEHAVWARSKRQVHPDLLRVLHEWGERDWPVALADVDVPVTLITGDVGRGAIVGAGMVAQVADRPPRGGLTHVPVPGAGHSIRREHRDVVVAAVLAAARAADRR